MLVYQHLIRVDRVFHKPKRENDDVIDTDTAIRNLQERIGLDALELPGQSVEADWTVSESVFNTRPREHEVILVRGGDPRIDGVTP